MSATFKPFTIPFANRRHRITNPKRQLWRQDQLARTGYPTIRGQQYMQRRALGKSTDDDRDQHVWLVVSCQTGKILAPNAKLFIREDPYQGREGK